MRPLHPWLALALVVVVSGLAAPAWARVHRDDWGDIDHDHAHDYDYDDHEYYDYPPPVVVVTVTRAMVDAQLSSAGLDACLESLVGRHRATVRVHVGADGRAHVRARSAPRDDDAETCLRRTAEAVLEWGAVELRVRRPFSTRIALRSTGTTPEAVAAGAEAMQAIVTSAHASLAACLDATGDGSAGMLTLSVRATRSGTLLLRDARVGRLVPDDEAAACLRYVVRSLAVDARGERIDTTVELPL